MADIIWDVLLSLFNTITTYFTAKYFLSIFAQKNKSHILLSYLTCIVFFVAPLLFSNPYLNMTVLVLCMLCVSLDYNVKLYNKVLYTFLFVAFNGLVEVITIILIKWVFSIDTVTAAKGVFFAMGTLIYKFVCLILCYLIGLLKNNKTLVGEFNAKWIPIFVLPVATLLNCCLIYRSMYILEQDSFLKNLSLICLILLIVSNMLIFMFVNNIREHYENKNKLLIAEELVKQQEKQYNILLDNNERIIKMRHDYKNFIIGVLSEIEEGNYSQVKIRLDKELTVLNDVSIHSVCGNSVVDTVINYKMLEAENKNIKLNFKYSKLKYLDISGVDLSIILGNAIDNAIEATEKLENELDKIVEVGVFYKGKQVLITVENKVRENIDTEILRSSKGEHHGYGIINMKAIVEKYNGTIDFSCENGVFSVFVILNVK